MTLNAPILRFDYDLDGHRDTRLVALDEFRSEVIGMVAVKAVGKQAASLYQLNVLEPFQGNGLGEKLVHAAEQVASSGGAQQLSLLVNEKAARLIAWYERLGYTAVWWETGQLLMTKTLH